MKRPSLGRYVQITMKVKQWATECAKVNSANEGREINKDAHYIAQSAIYDTPERNVWLGQPPPGVCNNVNLD